MSEGLAGADRAQAAPSGGEANGEAGLARAELDSLWARGRAFLGTDLAIMGGAMTWVSERNLVAAISNAGGFGVIASGAMSPDLLAGEIAAKVPSELREERREPRDRSSAEFGGLAEPFDPRKARLSAHSRPRCVTTSYRSLWPSSSTVSPARWTAEM